MSETNWNLVPLTPEYIEDEHGGYVAELENALKNDEIRNIALSGPYGVGKRASFASWRGGLKVASWNFRCRRLQPPDRPNQKS